MTLTQIAKLTFIDSNTMAFAKLQGTDVNYYMQRIEISLGRRYHEGPQFADVPLGFNEAISKFHAQIYYNFHNTRFELLVAGQSGATIGGNYVPVGTVVPLEHSMQVQIADVSFTFILPGHEDTRQEERRIVEHETTRRTGFGAGFSAMFKASARKKKVHFDDMNSYSSSSSDHEDTPAANYGQYTDYSTTQPETPKEEEESNDEVLQQHENESQSEAITYRGACAVIDEHKRSDTILSFPLHMLVIYVFKKCKAKTMSMRDICLRMSEFFPTFKKMRRNALWPSVIRQSIDKKPEFSRVNSYHNVAKEKWTLDLDKMKFRQLTHDVAEAIMFNKSKLDKEDPVIKLMDAFTFKSRAPPFSRFALVAHAFYRSKKRFLTIDEVVEHIKTHFPYYKSYDDFKLRHPIYLRKAEGTFKSIPLHPSEVIDFTPDEATRNTLYKQIQKNYDAHIAEVKDKSSFTPAKRRAESLRSASAVKKYKTRSGSINTK